MRSTRLLRFATVPVVIVLLSSGCSSAPPAQPVQRPQPMLGTPPAAESGQDPHQQSIEALRRKSEAHAEEMHRLMAERSRGASPQPVPTGVEWPGPDDAAGRPGAETVQPPATGRDYSAADPSPGSSPIVQIGPPPQPPPDGPDNRPRPEAAGSSQSVSPAPDRLEQMQQQLAGHIRDYPRDIAAHLDYQLLQFVLGEPVPRMAELATLPPEDQELITALLDGLSNFRSTVRADNNMLLSRKVRPLTQMAARLRSQADLHIPTLALCTRVDGFGVYEPIEPPRFAAGREQPVIIYTELQNFSSIEDGQSRWQTRLRQQAVLYTEEGLNVWEDQGHEIVDQSRNRRHDFFTVRLVRLPANLSVGRYILKVTVIDQQAGRVAEASLTIQIVAQ